MEKTTKTARMVLREWGWAEVVLALMTDVECDELLESVVMYPEG